MNLPLVIRRLRAADYARLSEAFDDLSEHSLAPNPHMAPASIAAASLLIPEDRIVILSAWQSQALGVEQLVGIWALALRRDWRSLFQRVLVAPLLPLYEVSSIPVVDRDRADEIIPAMLRHIASAPDLPGTLCLPLAPLDCESVSLICLACAELGSHIGRYETWERPMLLPQPGDDAARYLRRALGSSFKKRMQQMRAIAKAGEVSFRRRRNGSASEALDRFLALEAAGWKGRSGTAIASSPRDTAYFRKLVDEFAARDAVQIDTLLLNDEAIAMGLQIESAGTRHFLKIAYDESQGRHSPGRALTVAMLQADFAGTPAAVFDSGAGDGVDAGTYVWGERRRMGHIVVGLGRRMPGFAHLAASARQELRRLRDRLRKRQASLR